jgi:replication factor C subunit 2/4
MRVLEGVGTVVQLAGLLARLCKLQIKPSVFEV